MRLLGGSVVDFFNGLSELRDFMLKNLGSHSISNTISVDDEVVWVEFLGVPVAIASQSELQSICELLSHNFLTSFLDHSL